MIKNFYFRTLVRYIAWRLYVWAENIGNAHMKSNGEFYFLSHIPKNTIYGYKNFVFFDVGANVGDYSKAILRRFHDAEGHLFDPLKSCTDHLKTLFSKNELIHINNVAVSDIEGRSMLYASNPQDSHASFYRIPEHETSIPQEVETIILERYIETERISHIHLLKVDVEGYELNVLEGMGKYLHSDFVDLVQFEYGGIGVDVKTSLRSLYQLLESKGFCVCKLYPTGLRRQRYSPRMDNFIYANYVAVSPNFLQKVNMVH